MTDNTLDRRYTLLSLVEGEASVGVAPILPSWQIVHLHAPVNEWTIRRAKEKKYHLSANGYPYTGVEANRVIASIYPKHDKQWNITFSEHQNGFLIESADKPGYGWKVEDHQLVYGVLIAGQSDPPFYPLNQLFKFKGLVGGDLENLPIGGGN